MYHLQLPSLFSILRVSGLVLSLCLGCVQPVQGKPSDFIYTKGVKQDSRLAAAYIQSLRDPEQAYSLIKQFKAGKSGEAMTDWERVYYVLTMSRLEAYTLTDEAPIDIISELEVLAKKLKQPWIRGEALLHRAILAKETAQYDDGLAYLDEVLIIAKQTGFKNMTARALKWQANIWFYQSKYDQVLSNYLKALAYFEEQQDYAQVALVLSNIGNIYEELEQWSLAKKYNEEAFETYNLNNIKNDYTAALLNIHAGIVANYYNKGSEEAGYIRKAIKHASKTGSSYVQLVTLTNYTSVLLDENKLEASLRISQECLQLADNIKDKLGRAFCYESKSLAYFELKELNKAISTALVAIDIYKEYGSNSQVIRLYKLLSEIYSTNGNYKVSLEYFQRYVNDKESHYLSQKREEIRSLQTQYITQQKEHQIALLRAESQLKSSQIESQHSREIILLLSILLGIAILALLYRRNSHLSKDNVELAQSNVSLTEQSFQDPLTGMYNRRYIQQWITGQIKGDVPKASRYIVALLDIDYFKQINDLHGHDIGDRVLQELATRLQQSCRGNDKVARWGGEEFVAIFSVSESSKAHELLERIRRSVQLENVTIEDKMLAVTVSIGGVEVESKDKLAERWQEWLVKADSALYQVKENGRNGVKVEAS